MKTIALVAVSLSAILAHAPVSASLSDGLAAHYSFDGNGNDVSGNGNDLALSSGASFTQGVFGGGIRFNGTTGYARTNSVIGNLGQDATLTFWFNPDASNFLSEARVFEKDDRSYWIFTLNTSGLVVDLHGEDNYCCGPWYHLFAGTPTDFSGKWSAIALRKTGETFDLFVNGLLKESQITSVSTVITPAPLNFGNSSYWNAGYYAGGVDEARVYTRALTDFEIGQLAAVPESPTWALVGMGLLGVFGMRIRSSLWH